MTDSSDLLRSARPLPRRHLSIRVPWHDTGWTGTVCRHPAANTSCLVLEAVRRARDDAAEAARAGTSWLERAQSARPPCHDERVAFMAPVPYTFEKTHPFAARSEPFKHLRTTAVPVPAYSVLCAPYGWMLREEGAKRAARYGLPLQMHLEKEVDDLLRWSADWLQTGHNQRVMLDAFFGAVEPGESLCFFYAKRTPLVEDTARVLIGVGRVIHVGPLHVYDQGRPQFEQPVDSVIWERVVSHSIRPDAHDGFLLPYHAVLAHLADHPELDPADYVALVPDDQFWAFSYAGEHVEEDGAIAALMACSRALANCATIVPGPWDQVQAWISARLGELWQMRGPYPGIGPVLQAIGFRNGAFIAYALERLLTTPEGRGRDAWALTERFLAGQLALPGLPGARVEPTLKRTWDALPAHFRDYARLLSRFVLTPEQALRLWANKPVLAQPALANPYRLYEADWMQPDPLALGTLDRGVFPDGVIRANAPLRAPSAMDGDLDTRRVRAYAVEALRRAEAEGHTLLSHAAVAEAIRAQPVEPPLAVNDDILRALEPDFAPEVIVSAFADGSAGYQRATTDRHSQLIRTAVLRRQRGKRLERPIDWRARLDEVLAGPAQDEIEARARAEKTAALAELYAARISVLIGPAGTGKTTLLRVLLQEPSIQQGDVLLLAPTGKARVRLEQQTGLRGRAQTIAQFLLPGGRYLAESGVYTPAPDGTAKLSRAATVVIDEASMLTEAQLAATLDALQAPERIILVGDPRQLPPIGAGRPFLDIVDYLTPPDLAARFPRVAPSYAELTVRRRQRGVDRADLLLAEWFSGRPLDAGADEIWARLQRGEGSQHVRCIQWETPQDLERVLLEALVSELGLRSVRDVVGFEQSLGGVEYQGYVYFHPHSAHQPGAGSAVERWQILSPIRGQHAGVIQLNRLIQKQFRTARREDARKPNTQRRFPRPMGPEEIVYGDKVIHVRNERRTDVFPTNGALKYVANGEVGMVVGQMRDRNWKPKIPPWQLEVEFSTQPGYKYSYKSSSLGGEAGSPALELAYALTTHKAQGSEFERTFLVLPRESRLLSRELLYTALTRHQSRVILLHEGPLEALHRYTSDLWAEAPRRQTNLLVPAHPIEVEGRRLEGRFLNRTARGELVRGPARVLIANALLANGLEYAVEQRLPGADGEARHPDFTVLDHAVGWTFYWEHLGLLDDPEAKARWARKQAWYRRSGILPLVEGGGPQGALVWTEDAPGRPLDEAAVAAVVASLLEA